VLHNLGASWTLQRDLGHLTVSLEISNLTDAQVFDTFGVQRPGRAYYAKLIAEL
jgi:outer membrane receptor protein involved in Fe transport